MMRMGTCNVLFRGTLICFMAVACIVFTAAVGQCDVVGTDGFDYPDGSIVDQTGGLGWEWELVDETTSPPSTSDWDGLWGTQLVSSGALVTDNSGAKREFGGAGEGFPPSDEGDGAFRGEGIVYFGADFTPSDIPWGGMSSYDFGAERIFFGRPGQDGTSFFGIDESGVGVTLSDIPVVVGQTYRLVSAVDFDGDELRLWVDPDGSDFDNGTGDNSADVTRTYGGTNWSTAVRLASGAQVVWDDLIVATTFDEAVPEPSSMFLVSLAFLFGLGVARRRS